MYDINKAVTEHHRLDPYGNFLDLQPWSPKSADRMAREEGLELTEAHWEIIFYLRERFREYGQARSAREILRELQGRFDHAGGRRDLYTLFPRGPVSQGSRIAGLPLPPYSSDPSFGSVE